MYTIFRSATIIFFFAIPLFSQINKKWESSATSSLNAAGWVSVEELNGIWDNRYYVINEDNLQIMSSGLSSTVEYSYNFTNEEKTAGNQIYSLGADITGDNISEFYVLAYHGDEENYRQSFKIIDITDGSAVFEKNSSSYYYSYPAIWDIENDGLLDLSFTKYDYPNYAGMSYEVYSTNVPVSNRNENPNTPVFKLKQNYPNPFNPSTNIDFRIDTPGGVEIEIYNSAGEHIKTLVDEYMVPGNYSRSWNGKNSSGDIAASGAYYYRITSGRNSSTKKMILLR